MKKLFYCLLMLPILTACAKPSLERMKPLTTVELNYPNSTFTFLSTGKKYRSGSVFPPPKIIDCSKLDLDSDAFEDAIEAGAPILRIHTPRQIKRIVKDEEGKPVTETVKINPVYGGVLALCKVSDNATGPDSRSYRIRGLDDYLLKGRDGRVSVVGAIPGQGNSTDFIENLMGGKVSVSQLTGSATYSWMLWLTDRTTTFTNYKAEMERRRRRAKAARLKREREAKAAEAKAQSKARREARKAKAASSIKVRAESK
ncbi:MAG: hypothetical protein D3909_13260 [Candidatus Electrothrix sp. ATG1]|nr:hypothetical protein [Candidatus Electrothrix sp. ATG1]